MARVAVTDHRFRAGQFVGEVCDYTYPDTRVCGKVRDAHETTTKRIPTLPNLSPNPAQSEAETAFAAYAEAVQALVRAKDQAYGGAWRKQGYMGNLARIMSKTARLEAMLWSDNAIPEAVDEAVTDTLKDLMALAAFMAANIEDGNQWGR